MVHSRQAASRRPLPKKKTPRGEQIKQYILQKIVGGEWAPDRRVPSEVDLLRKFDCARMTVHYALKELRDEGYLVRRQGLGTFVARPHVHLAVFKLTDIADDARVAGREHSLVMVRKVEKRATREQANDFRIRPGDILFHSTVIHLVDGRPAQLEKRIVNARAIPDYLQHDFSRQTPFALLMERVPYPQGRMTLRATVPTAEERKLLRIPAGRACIELDRLTWNSSAVYSHARVLLCEPQTLLAEITPPAVSSQR